MHNHEYQIPHLLLFVFENISAAMSTIDKNEKIRLLLQNKVEYDIPRHYVEYMTTLKNLLEDLESLDTNDNSMNVDGPFVVPLEEVSFTIMSRVCQFCRLCEDKKDQNGVIEFGPWIRDFYQKNSCFKNRIINTADYLDFDILMNAGIDYFGEIIEKTVKNIDTFSSMQAIQTHLDVLRKELGLKNDILPERQRQIIRDSHFCQDVTITHTPRNYKYFTAPDVPIPNTTNNNQTLIPPIVS